jgi:hypothetical protein
LGGGGAGEGSGMAGDPYDAAVLNIRETVKWLIGSIGAVFVTLLAGVQFNGVPFATDGAALAAGIAAGVSLMITFALAIRTLVGGSVSFEGLMTEARLWPTRRFINRTWGGLPEKNLLLVLDNALKEKDALILAGTLGRNDPDYKDLNERAGLSMRVARWHIVKWRFNLLVGAMMLLIPIELAAASIMFSAGESDDSGTTLTIEFKQGR